jgi:magnesium transporter
MADLLEQLPGVERDVLVESLDTSLEAITYTHLDDAVPEDIIGNFDNVAPASVVIEPEYDDAVDSIENLEACDQQEILEAMLAQDQILFEDSLRLLEVSAGRLKRRDVATIPSYRHVGQIIDCMSSVMQLPYDFYLLMVVGPTCQPIGIMSLSRLLRTSWKRKFTLS